MLHFVLEVYVEVLCIILPFLLALLGRLPYHPESLAVSQVRAGCFSEVSPSSLPTHPLLNFVFNSLLVYIILEILRFYSVQPAIKIFFFHMNAHRSNPHLIWPTKFSWSLSVGMRYGFKLIIFLNVN